MKKKVKILLLIAIGVVLVMIQASCTPKFFRNKGMTPSGSVVVPRSNLLPAFDSLQESRYYTAQIDYKNNSMVGVLGMTEETPGHYRMVMMTTFGMTLFDFTISKTEFIVNSCIEQMNKKMVLKILEKDFRSILMLNLKNKIKGVLYQVAHHKEAKDEETQQIVTAGYQLKADDGVANYLVVAKDGEWVRMIENGSSITRMSAVFNDDIVTIEHPKLGLKMVMTRMEN